MKIYISGAITGIENYEKAFDKAEAYLIGEGHQVINPCKIIHDHDKTWLNYMREDLKSMLDCDAVYMLIGYSKSKGAMIEYSLAKDLGILVIYECFSLNKKCIFVK